MKRMYITTIFRREGVRGKEGRIYAVDWETKAPLWEMKTKAVRGMVFVDDRLFVASFDNELRTVNTEAGRYTGDTWKYPEIGNLHKLYYREDRNVFVMPNTRHDSVATVDAGTMCLLDMVAIDTVKYSVRKPFTKSPSALHFNSMGWDAKGCEYHVYHNTGMVVNADTEAIIFDGLGGAHDLEFIDECRAIINHTGERKTLVGNVKTGELETIFEAADGPSTTVSIWGGTRGAAYHNGLFFTGSFPVDIHLFEVNSWKRLDWWRLSSTREESLFDICLDPRDWL